MRSTGTDTAGNPGRKASKLDAADDGSEYESCEDEKRRSSRIRRQNKRIEKPWEYETGRPITEPPDVNYRRLIIRDQVIDQLLENHNLHFTVRCERYRHQDVGKEKDVMSVYMY